MEIENQIEKSENIITISAKAVSQIQSVIAQQNQNNLFLRVFVQSGCGGINFGMAIDMKKQPDDNEFVIDGLPIVVDRISMQYVEGATIDFDESGEKSGFRINNPRIDEMNLGGGGSCCSSGDGAAAGCGAGSGGCC